MAVPQIAVKVVSDEPVDDEYLEDILADKLGGQSNVVSIHRESDEKVIVTLKNQEDADKLVSVRKIDLADVILHISKHEQILVASDVLVENLPADFKESKLKLLIKGVSLQGKIKSIKPLTESSVVVSFENMHDAAKLAQKKNFNYQQTQLSIRLYTAEHPVPTVYITGLPDGCDDEMLHDILEELFHKEVPIKEFQFLPENESAMVTFENLTDSRKLLDLKSSQIEDYNLNLKFSAKPPSGASPKSSERNRSRNGEGEKRGDNKTKGKSKVLISKLPKRADKEFIENFFENTRLWKGGDVTEVVCYEDMKTASVTFLDSSDAQQLIEEGTLDMKGAVVAVDWYEDKQAGASDIDDTRTIVVSGLPSDVDEEDIQMYFENRRQKGGPVEKVERDEESGTAVVCFQDCEVAQRMVDNGTMRFKGEEMTIKWYECTSAEDEVDGDDHKRVLVTGLPSNFDEEAIQMFFESKRQDGGPVEHVKYEESEGQAVVTFEDSSDAERIVNKGQMKMKKATIYLQWYKVTDTGDKKTVCVTGLPSGIHKDYIQMFFESARQNGGPVDNVEYESGDETAVVTFEDSEVAETIVAKKEMTMKQNTVKVDWHRKTQAMHGQTKSGKRGKMEDKRAGDLLEVTNIPKGCEEDHVKLKVESLVRSDDNSIQEMSYNPSEGRAIVTFIDSKMAQKVLEKLRKKPLVLNGQTLELKIIDSSNLGKHALCANSCALEITDLPPCTDEYLMKENLELVFENPQNTKNEAIEDLYITADLQRAVITYKTPQVAGYVMGKHAKTPFCIEEQKVHVEIMPALTASSDSKKAMEEKILCVMNLPECITSEDIHSFVELFCDADVSDIIYSQNVGDALILFRNPPDFGRLFETFGMKPLRGNMVTPLRVEQSRTLEVYGICKPKDIGKNKLSLYFEGRKAGGGEVESVEIDKEMDCAIVKFKHVKDARNVLKTPNHAVQNQTVKVKLHHECIGLLPDWFDSSRPPVDGPIETRVSCGSKNIVLFLLQSQKQMKLLEDNLKSLSAEVEWPNVDKHTAATGLTLTLKCTLDEESSDYKTQASDWQTKVTECVHSHTNNLDENEISVSKDIADDMDAFVQKSYSSKSEEVMVMLMRGQKFQIVVAGLTPEVQEITENINKQMANIKRRSTKKMHMKSLEVTSLTARQLQYLAQIEFDKTVEETYEDFTVNIETENGKLTFHGTDEENKKAKADMDKIIRKLCHKQQTFSKEIIDMFNQEEVFQYALASLKDAGFTCVGFSVSDETLEVTCDNDKDLEKAIEHLIECVSDESFQVSEDDCVILKTNQWRDLEKELTKTHGMKLNLMEGLSCIRIIATQDIASSVYEKIEEFFRSHSVSPEFIPANKSVAKLFDRASEIPGIYGKYSETEVKINAELGGSNPGIAVKAGSEIRGKVLKEVKAAASGVVHKTHIVHHPGMSDYFKNEKSGQSMLKTIERDHNVVIELEDEVTTSTEDEETSSIPTRRSAIVTVDVNDVKLELVQDDILQQNCDAIMVPVTKELVPLKGTAKRILDRAGESVHRDLNKQKHKVTKTGQCLTTKAGNLECDVLIYSTFPVNQEEEETAIAALVEVWKTAGSKNVDSIALPWSIFHKYPSKVAVKALKQSLSKDRGIRDIYLVAEDKSTVLTLQRMASILSPDFSKTVDYMGFASPVIHKMSLYQTGSDEDTVCTNEGIEVTLVRGEIAKQRVDVIVNTADSSFKLNIGAVSNSILKEGGRVIQRECDEIVHESGFSPDKIIETNGGKLKCKKVFHITLNNWGTGNTEVKQDLSSKVTRCLEKANKSRSRSIAFPAVGTGNLGYPKEYVAKLMYESIYKFSKNNPRLSLKQVNLVVYHEDEPTIQKFEDIAHEVCSPGYYGLPDEKAAILRPKKHKILKRKSLKIPARLTMKRKIMVQENLDTHDVKIGPIKIQLAQGDITEETTDAIVNSTDSNLSFDSQLSKAILRAAGNKIQRECSDKGRIKDVTITGAGKLECSNIIHIAAPNIDTEWKQRISVALELANMRSLESISFPALGTGAMSVESAIMCDMFMDAIATFVEKQKRPSIDLIRIVIFEEEMFEVFKTEVKVIVDSKSRGYSWVPKKQAGRKKKPGAVQVLPTMQAASNSGSEEEESRQLIDTMVPAILKSIALKVTAFNKDAADSAVNEIDHICETECEESEIPVSDPDILSEEQSAQIEDLERYHAVSLTVDSRAPCVRIKGRGKEVGVVYRKVTDLLREAENILAEEKEQEEIYETARWQFFNKDGKDFEDYPIDTNFKIEKAHKAQYEHVEWTEVDDKTYRIDFKNMQEYPVGDRAKATDVRKYSPAEFDLPSTWTKMDPTENLAVYKTSTSKREGETVLREIQHSMAETNYLKEVISIERIQNKRLYRNYMINRTAVQMANPRIKLVERKLWHGTTINAVEGISTSGFNRAHAFAHSSVTNYGKGVYFATEASEAHHYTFQKDKRPPKDNIHIMYMCKVLTGDYTLGDEDMVEPPTKDKATKKKYDSVVDNVNDPHIFVVFYDAWAYPEYLIKYKGPPSKRTPRKTDTDSDEPAKRKEPPRPPPKTPESETEEESEGEGGEHYETYASGVGSYVEG